MEERNISYICKTQNDLENCQLDMFKKGIGWGSDCEFILNKYIYVPFPIVIHVTDHLGFDNYDDIKDDNYNFKVYSCRKKKLNTIR